MPRKPERYNAPTIEPLIITIRGQKVILDRDLAVLVWRADFPVQRGYQT